MSRVLALEQLPQLIGQELALSDWLLVDQTASTASPTSRTTTSGSTSIKIALSARTGAPWRTDSSRSR
jgi:hypothetical protein